MKKKLFYLFVIPVLFPYFIYAQKNLIKFHSINQVGVVGGESQLNSTIQTTNGIKFSNWFSGIGIGVDNYRYKTMPLFIDVRRYFDEENKAFIYGSLGYNFPFNTKPDKETEYYDTYHFKGGIYTDIGIGFKTKFIRKSSLLFSIGHSYKQLRSRYGITPLCLGCQPSWYNYKWGYGRIALKTGIEF